MLIECPECQNKISSAALYCPNCGYTNTCPNCNFKSVAQTSLNSLEGNLRINNELILYDNNTYKSPNPKIVIAQNSSTTQAHEGAAVIGFIFFIIFILGCVKGCEILKHIAN